VSLRDPPSTVSELQDVGFRTVAEMLDNHAAESSPSAPGQRATSAQS
jgi:hypothetical protein